MTESGRISLSSSTPALHQVFKNAGEVEQINTKLATGKKLTSGKNTADYQIAKSLEQRVRTSEQAITNISTANNMMKVADSSVNSAINVLQNMRELAVHYYDGSLSDDQKDAIKDRLNAMGLEVQQILDDGIFNGHEIFDKDEQTFTYHVGSDSNDQLNVNMPAVDLDLSFETEAIVDLVVLMDNSGSLGDEQEGLKNNIQNLIDELEDENVDLALGLTRFGAAASSGNPIVGSLTTDSDYFINTVLDTNTTDGSTEPAYDAISETAEQMTFRENSDKFFMIVADENPDQGSDDVQDALEAMQDIDATLYAVTEPGWYDEYEPITDGTDGQAININDDFSSVLSDITDSIITELNINFIDKVDTALKTLLDVAQTIGNTQNRLSIKERHVSEHILNTEAARSRIEDTDFAKEMMNKLKAEMLFQTSQKQLFANLNSANYILKLISG